MFPVRYEIQRDTIEGKPHCRYAVDSFTGQRVFLKFYTSSSHKLDNALRIHALLQTKTCACKCVGIWLGKVRLRLGVCSVGYSMRCPMKMAFRLVWFTKPVPSLWQRDSEVDDRRDMNSKLTCIPYGTGLLSDDADACGADS